MKPVLLLADSQLLFAKTNKGEYYLKSVFGEAITAATKCAYIGCSNGDEIEFYKMFTEAMKLAGANNCVMISSDFNDDEKDYLNDADLVLLAGGNSKLGLQIFREKGIDKIIQQKYEAGALLIGVSAGAVQLGWEITDKKFEKEFEFTEALKIVPFIVLAHANKSELNEVEPLLKRSPLIKRAYEIPFGSGIVYHPDNTIEAVRKPVNEFVLKDDEVFINTLIYPANK